MNVNVIVIVLFMTIIGIIAQPTFAQEFEDPNYTIRRGEIDDFKIDLRTSSLTISLNPRANGELTITLPRDLIDAKIGSEDSDFIVFINNIEYQLFEETITLSDRTLSIPFGPFDSEITIMGTHVFSQRATLPDVIPQRQIENKIVAELKSEIPEGKAKLLIFSNTEWSGALQASGFDYTEINGEGDITIIFGCETTLIRQGIFAAKLQKMTEGGYLKIVAIQNKIIMDQKSTEVEFAEVFINGNCVSETGSGGGGCLIATAAFGSELAPQVQELREVRDNIVLNSRVGTAFLTGFNQLYYSFSPTIADWERQSPVFKEIVKMAITPLVTSLSILNYVDIDSEEEVLGYGIGVILLNVGMYFVAPAMILHSIRRKLI